LQLKIYNVICHLVEFIHDKRILHPQGILVLEILYNVSLVISDLQIKKSLFNLEFKNKR